MPGRPPVIGHYALLEDFEAKEASIRIIRLASEDESVDVHLHRRSVQFYVVLDGEVVVSCDGVSRLLRQYEVFRVPRESVHGVRPAGDWAVVANISVPPLAADDQSAAPLPHERRDMRLPGDDSDLED